MSNKFNTQLCIIFHISWYNIFLVSCTITFSELWNMFSVEYSIIILYCTTVYLLVNLTIWFFKCTRMTWLKSLVSFTLTYYWVISIMFWWETIYLFCKDLKNLYFLMCTMSSSKLQHIELWLMHVCVFVSLCVFKKPYSVE